MKTYTKRETDSPLESLLLSQIRLLTLPEPEKGFRFNPPRDWKFDFCWPDLKLAVEVEGHPSHRTTRFETDCMKYDEATIRGWRVLRATSAMVKDGRAAALIRRAFCTFAPESRVNIPSFKILGEKETKMPVVEPTVKRNPLPPGDHLLNLVSVTETEQPSYSNPKEFATRWIWQFKAQMRDEETGERYEFRQYSGTKYGNPKAGLTILLDMMCPDMDDEEKQTLDTDTILGRNFKAKIRHDKPEKAGDPPKPVLVFIEPYTKPKAAPKVVEPVKEEEEDEDPFADE